jgi:trehalose 6-phosphate synthase
MAERLVVVSNRVPLSAQAARTWDAVPEAGDGPGRVLWFGWSGRLSHEPEAYAMASPGFDGALNFVGVDLTQNQYEGYLNGFANGTLWPLFHDMPDRIRFHADELAYYRAVNSHFAERLAPLLRPDDRIWIHDYHLIPMACLLRQCGVTNPIGLFLHVPFPVPAGLLAWPWHKRVASDLAAYDLVGFQTKRDERNFEAFMRAGGPHTLPTTGVFPAGLPTRLHMASAASADSTARVQRLGQASHGRALIVSADRLDYTKGLIERLRAYERLLDESHAYRGTCALVQITAPSRPLVSGYLELRQAQQAVVEEINGRYLTRGWMPVMDIYARLPQGSLAALYRLGRVGLATPLRDGINLAAKEFVAAQDPRDPGALVLSRHAGAAELLTEATLVDPQDIGQVAQALRDALRMPLHERQDRWRRMIVKLLHHDAAQWHRSYVAALAHAYRNAARRPVTVARTPDLRAPAARAGVGRAAHRLATRTTASLSSGRRRAARALSARWLRPGVA